MDPITIGLGVLTLIGVIFIGVRQESNTTAINNAAGRIPQETDASEITQTLNNLIEAFNKTGKKQTGLVVYADGAEVVLTVRPQTVKAEVANH